MPKIAFTILGILGAALAGAQSAPQPLGPAIPVWVVSRTLTQVSLSSSGNPSIVDLFTDGFAVTATASTSTDSVYQQVGSLRQDSSSIKATYNGVYVIRTSNSSTADLSNCVVRRTVHEVRSADLANSNGGYESTSWAMASGSVAGDTSGNTYLELLNNVYASFSSHQTSSEEAHSSEHLLPISFSYIGNNTWEATFTLPGQEQRADMYLSWDTNNATSGASGSCQAWMKWGWTVYKAQGPKTPTTPGG